MTGAPQRARATDFATYEAYAAARAAEGLQALPRTLWRALKEGRPEIVERRDTTPART